MTNGTLTRTYLAELREAVGDLPFRVASDILAGVEEELEGLDDAAAAERIAQLGSPASIAESASRELGIETAAAEPQKSDAVWYTLATALLLFVGGLAIPIVGWIAGVVLLWASRTWTLRDKLIGTLAPPLGGYWIVAAITGVGYFPQGADTLVVGIPVVAITAWILVILPFATFAYLLVRARRLKARR